MVLKNVYTIYKVTNILTGKIYIGFDSSWPNRKRIHKSASKNEKDQTKFYRAIRKYGWENFIWNVIYQSENKEYTLNEMEQHFIEIYDSFNNGYNSTKGGDGTFGHILTEESKKIISEKNRIPKPNSGNRTNHRRGENHPFFGKKLSEEHKKKIGRKTSLALKGKPKTHKENLSFIKTIECPHCGKMGSLANMKRWHFNNCKKGLDNVE